ncbi:hypothetical protein [Dehalogenimonas alkenigignens]|uniref:Uncharacterized protein n=1 Tax=Dehalogenimonas alkenigignens TaxID=1217799 RepID=A0A0W0GLD8_9CHLR|nr:hypothetical protein [Dehalogenimonas alkenigignens]KTB49345.1 hypothetical protein DEALK_02580 [Dehalogenimonas alkenigignens]PVV83785.1 hypothetical protein DD509_06055 [Dehalogenimonas alkenigignens]
MFGLFKKNCSKKALATIQTVSLTLENEIYQTLEHRARLEGVSREEELVRALRRGMADYWLYVLDDSREDFEYISGLIEEYRQDIEKMRDLETQNLRFREILKNAEMEG